MAGCLVSYKVYYVPFVRLKVTSKKFTALRLHAIDIFKPCSLKHLVISFLILSACGPDIS